MREDSRSAYGVPRILAELAEDVERGRQKRAALVDARVGSAGPTVVRVEWTGMVEQRLLGAASGGCLGFKGVVVGSSLV